MPNLSNAATYIKSVDELRNAGLVTREIFRHCVYRMQRAECHKRVQVML